MKTLIVDDSAIIRMAINKYLKPFNPEVVGTAGNGREALELFKIHRPRLVTLDITMPEMDGLACLEAMIETDPSAKILIITALKDEYTGIKALKMGAVGFLTKPFTENALIEEIKEILKEGT